MEHAALPPSAPDLPRVPDYEIIDRIGAGATGVVYRARQINLNRVVAIKVITAGEAGDDQARHKLIAEAKAAARLSHPNIVQAYDVVETGDLTCFVMEYVQGDTVAQRLQKRGLYEERDAIKIVRQVALALAHAHQAGLVHCDVKPQNIIVTPGRVAKLADLGLARSGVEEREVPGKGKSFGTPHYMSPEQVRGATDIDARTDIYSLGATFYHMVAGRVPFTGDTPAEVMRKHLTDALEPPDQVCNEVSLSVASVIEMMMSKRPAERHASARQLIEDLDALAAGRLPTHARHEVSPLAADFLRQAEEAAPPAWKPRERLWRASALVWALLVFSVLLNLLLLLLWPWRT